MSYQGGYTPVLFLLGLLSGAVERGGKRSPSLGNVIVFGAVDEGRTAERDGGDGGFVWTTVCHLHGPRHLPVNIVFLDLTLWSLETDHKFRVAMQENNRDSKKRSSFASKVNKKCQLKAREKNWNVQGRPSCSQPGMWTHQLRLSDTFPVCVCVCVCWGRLSLHSRSDDSMMYDVHSPFLLPLVTASTRVSTWRRRKNITEGKGHTRTRLDKLAHTHLYIQSIQWKHVSCRTNTFYLWVETYKMLVAKLSVKGITNKQINNLLSYECVTGNMIITNPGLVMLLLLKALCISVHRLEWNGQLSSNKLLRHDSCVKINVLLQHDKWAPSYQGIGQPVGLWTASKWLNQHHAVGLWKKTWN